MGETGEFGEIGGEGTLSEVVLADGILRCATRKWFGGVTVGYGWGVKSLILSVEVPINN